MKPGFLISFCAFIAVPAQTHSPLPPVTHKVVMIAHRGNHERVPENTLASIREAIAVHADYAEVDLRTTRDGFLILSHDANLKRMTGKDIVISETSWDSIRTVNLLGCTSNDAETMHVPLFAEVLRKSRNKINIYLDFKDANALETLRQIRQAGMERQVVVYLNRPAQYAEWKLAAPQMPLMCSVPDSMAEAHALDRYFASRPVEVFDNVHDSNVLAAAHRNGVRVWLDVQDANEGPKTWAKALQLGVDGLQTDHPASMREFLKH